MPKVPSWEEEAGAACLRVVDDGVEHSSSSLIFFDRYFSQEVE
jgi:hypothetical protein